MKNAGMNLQIDAKIHETGQYPQGIWLDTILISM